MGRIVLPLTGPLGGHVVAPPNGLSVRKPCLGWLAAELRNRERVLGTTMDSCRICGSATRTCCTGRSEEADHILPVADGGTDDPENLREVCRHCYRARYWSVYQVSDRG